MGKWLGVNESVSGSSKVIGGQTFGKMVRGSTKVVGGFTKVVLVKIWENDRGSTKGGGGKNFGKW